MTNTKDVTTTQLEFIEWVKTIENLSKHIRTVHDLAVHHSDIPIENELKDSLCFTAQCANWIDEINSK